MSKAKGTRAESAVAAHLRGAWPAVERRALAGAADKGDIAGVPDVTIEVKAHVTPRHTAWLAEVERERCNAGTDVGIVVAKPRGVGETRVGQWHVIMTLDTFIRIWQRCEGSSGSSSTTGTGDG